MRNLEAKVPEHLWPDVRSRAKAAYEAPSPEMANALRDDFIAQYARELPAAVQCFGEDFAACTAHLRFPIAHRKVIRTTNLLERLFGEGRRRMKVIANAFGERPVLKLMYAALIRATAQWRGITVTAFERKQWEVLRQEVDAAHGQRHVSPVPRSRARRRPGADGER